MVEKLNIRETLVSNCPEPELKLVGRILAQMEFAINSLIDENMALRYSLQELGKIVLELQNE